MNARDLKRKLAAAAQQVYDDWQPGEDDDLNGGGICHLIADAFCEVLDAEGFAARTVSSTMTEAGVHVYAAFEAAPGQYMRADIPYFVYEKGFGYSWEKLPEVIFDASDVIIDHLPWSEEDWQSED